MHETLLLWLDKDVEQVHKWLIPSLWVAGGKMDYAMRVKKGNKIWQFGQITLYVLLV